MKMSRIYTANQRTKSKLHSLLMTSYLLQVPDVGPDVEEEKEAGDSGSGESGEQSGGKDAFATALDSLEGLFLFQSHLLVSKSLPNPL